MSPPPSGPASNPPCGLRVAGVSTRFGETIALNDVSFEIPSGHMLVLLGPSGCGKTTLLRVVAGLEQAESGLVAVDDDIVVGPGVLVPAERRRIGLVFQDWALFPHLTVARNVAYGLPRNQARGERVAEVLDLMDMGHLAHRKPDELSAGQAQRVALARALAPRPRLLLFDEPFSSLDAELRKQVRRDVTALMRKMEMTAVFVTHDQEEAFLLGDTVAVMADAEIVQVGSPAHIYSNPANPWVAGFVGDANLLSAEGDGNRATTSVGDVSLRREMVGRCRVLARPEHLVMTAGAAGEVVDVDFFGHDTTYRVRMNESGEGAKSLGSAELMVRAIAVPRFRLGDRVNVSYQGPAAVAFPPGD
jgi:iron(III) transport system ATP-binding protein